MDRFQQQLYDRIEYHLGRIPTKRELTIIVWEINEYAKVYGLRPVAGSGGSMFDFSGNLEDAIKRACNLFKAPPPERVYQ